MSAAQPIHIICFVFGHGLFDRGSFVSNKLSRADCTRRISFIKKFPLGEFLKKNQAHYQTSEMLFPIGWHGSQLRAITSNCYTHCGSVHCRVNAQNRAAEA